MPLDSANDKVTDNKAEAESKDASPKGGEVDIQMNDDVLRSFVADEFATPRIKKLQSMVSTFSDSFNKDSAGKDFEKNFGKLKLEINGELKKNEAALDKEQVKDEQLLGTAMRKEVALDREINKLPEDKQQQVRDLMNPKDDEDIDSRETRVMAGLKDLPQLVKPYIDFEEARFAKEAHQIGTMKDIALDLQSINHDIERADSIKAVVSNRANQFPTDLENESVRIAGMMDRDQTHSAMKDLSKDLKQLNDVHFNQLLLNIYTNEAKGDGVDLDLGPFNRKTGTFAYARVDHSALHVNHPNPYAIVQSGDSISRIAKGWLNTKHNNTDVAKYTQEIARANGLKNPDSIKPGQALLLPHTAKHRFPSGE